VKRWKTTLIVAGIFCVLLAYVLLVEDKKEPPAELRPGVTPSPTPAPIFDIALEDVRALQIRGGANQVTRLTYADGTWRVALPKDDLADDTALAWTMSELIRLEARQIVSEQVADPAVYALDEPALTLVIEAETGTETIHVGRETPDGSAFYIQRQGDPRLYIIDHYKVDALLEWLAQPPYQPTPTPAAPS
jgi:uncharacterized protein DUF4340